MIDGWKLEIFRAMKLWSNVAQEAAASSAYVLPILIGICGIVLASAMAAWSLRRALRRDEEGLIELLRQEMRYEFERQQEIQTARTAFGAGNDVPEQGRKLRDHEDESMERILSSMRRVKNQKLGFH